jgi:hypothetical protein
VFLLVMDSVSAAPFHTPHDLLGAVPYLLGYHPDDELVAIYRGIERRISHVAAFALNEPTEMLIEHLAVSTPAGQAATVVVIGYGAPSASDKLTAIGEVADLLLPVHGLLLVTDRRCVCLIQGCTCTASTGIDIDPANTQAATRLAVAGRVALPSRQALHGLAAPDPVRQAETETALAALPTGFEPGTAYIDSALVHAEQRRRLTAEQTAQVAVALTHRDPQATAWRSCCGCMWQRDLWLDLTRRVPERYVTGPATLAAWCAWRRGEHVLAGIALQRARQVQPDDPLTRLVGQILGAHVPAHRIEWPAKH